MNPSYLRVSQKGFAHLFLLIILLIGLVATIYLVQNPQIFKSRASLPGVYFKSEDDKPLAEVAGVPQTASSRVKIEVTSTLGPPARLPQVQALILKAGKNYVGLTLDKGSNYKAADFLTDLNSSLGAQQVSQIGKFSNGQWVVNSSSNNFQIIPGEGFVVISSKSGYVTLNGVTAVTPSIQIKKGFNFISFPGKLDGISTAESLLQALKLQGINVSNVTHYIDDSKGEIHPINTQDANFDIGPGEGYMVRSSSDGSFNIKFSPFQYNVDDFKKAMGSIKGKSPNYNSLYDFDNNGQINITDFSIGKALLNQPSPSASKTKTTLYYKITENVLDLDDDSKSPKIPYSDEPTLVNRANGGVYEFKEQTPGDKFVFVRFYASDGSIDTLPPKKINLISRDYDLDVTFIERTPRYFRYCVQYQSTDNGVSIPKLCPGTENQKHWPDAGETVTYTAHVINKGSKDYSGGFTYQWLVNDQAKVGNQYGQKIATSQEITFTYQMSWNQSSDKIEFKVIPTTPDLYSVNNNLVIHSRDLTLSYFVEKAYYDQFNKTQNMVGTYSLEDWIQAHIKNMNQKFSQAKYPVAPDGIKDTVRIDKIVVAEQLDTDKCPANPMSQDPDLYLIDGRWQMTDGDCTNANIKQKVQEYLTSFAKNFDWGLNHEVTHQLGVIDLYRLGIPHDHPNFGIKVLDINGNLIPRTNLPDAVPPGYPGLMGGGDTSPYNDGNYYESHTAGGLNSHYNQRRGYYGEYLFDTPSKTSIKLVDNKNNPIAKADVSLYQKSTAENIENTPQMTGKTNDQGVMELTNRKVFGVTTATGHTLKDNPFGQIAVAGYNDTDLIVVTKDNKQGYGFIYVTDLNLAYWAGNKDSATITVLTTYPIVSLDPKLAPTPTPNPIGAFCTACKADVNGSGEVTVDDVVAIDICMGKKPTEKDPEGNSCSKMDLNNNGIVDASDEACAQGFSDSLNPADKICKNPVPPPPPATSPPPTTLLQLKNAGFEYGLDGWSCSVMKDGLVYNDTKYCAVRITTNDEKAEFGSQVAEVISGVIAGDTKYNSSTTLSQGKFPFTAGDQFCISGRVNIEDPTSHFAEIGVTYSKNSDFSNGMHVHGIERISGWQKFRGTVETYLFTVPGDSLTVYLQGMSLRGSAPTKVWFDNISITPGACR